MHSIQARIYPSWMYGPLGGAALAAGLTFAYALVFIVYATLRSSLLVVRVNPDAGVPGTVVAYFFTLTIATLAIAALMAVPAALVGFITAPVLKRVVSLLVTSRNERRTAVVGAASCLAIALLLLVLFQRMLGFAPSDVVANPETFLLWFAFPALIFVAAGGLAGRELNRVPGAALDTPARPPARAASRPELIP